MPRETVVCIRAESRKGVRQPKRVFTADRGRVQVWRLSLRNQVIAGPN